MARVTHIGNTRRTRLSLHTGPITDFRFEPGGFGHSASHPPRAEVAGPYRGQSSVPSIRREASPREHRTVPSRAPAASAPVVQSPRIPSVHAGARPSLGALASLIAPLAPSLLGLARPTVSALPDILAHALAPMAPTTVPPALEQRTLGSPSLHELLGAGAAGRLGLNAAGKITTPRIRSAVGSLRQARSQLQRTSGLIGPLTPGQRTFAQTLAHDTGLSPRVVGAQALAEESGSAALQREAEGNQNWLNVGYFDSGPAAFTANRVWSDPRQAAHQTARFLKGEVYGASPGIRSILSSAHQPPAAQIAAIGRSGWATNPNYQQSLEGTYGLLAERHNPRAAQAYRQAAHRARALGIPMARGDSSSAAPAPAPVSRADSRYFVRTGGDEHLRFVPLFEKRLAALAKASGEPLQINSGFRTYAEQEASYRDYLAGGTLAAKPGSSNHEFGLAADIQLTPKQRALLPRFGLGLPVAGENWHVELTDPTLRAKAGYDSPGSVGAVPYGGSTGGAVLAGSGTSSTPGAGQAPGEQPGAGLGLVSLTSPLAAGPVMPDIPGVSEGEDPSAELLALLTRGRRRLG